MIFLWTLLTKYIFLGQRELSQVHQVGQQGEGHLQAGGQQGGVQAVGAPQEQARHELRDDGSSAEVLLPEGHPRQGRWSEAGLSVRQQSSQRTDCGNT